MKNLTNNIIRIQNKIYVKKLLKNEKYFEGEVNLKYLFIKEEKSDELLVIFSGFPAQNKPAAYNYVSTLKNIKMNKIFILDDFGFDKRGSYYLGTDGNLNIFNTVNKLLKSIITKGNIKKITTLGSSKGGYAALLFAFHNNFSRVIVGEPQFLLGNYLSITQHQHIYKFIMGKINEKNTNYLNYLLYSEIDNSKKASQVYINCGAKGEYRETHIKELMETLSKKNIWFSLKEDDYEKHSDLVKYFPDYLIDILKK